MPKSKGVAFLVAVASVDVGAAVFPDAQNGTSLDRDIDLVGDDLLGSLVPDGGGAVLDNQARQERCVRDIEEEGSKIGKVVRPFGHLDDEQEVAGPLLDGDQDIGILVIESELHPSWT